MTATKLSGRGGLQVGQTDWVALVGQFGALLVLVVICVIFWWLEPAFASQRNIFNVLLSFGIWASIILASLNCRVCTRMFNFKHKTALLEGSKNSIVSHNSRASSNCPVLKKASASFSNV